MGDFVAEASHRGPDRLEEPGEHRVAIPLAAPRLTEADLGIEPAEEGLAIGVAVVVDLPDRPRAGAVGEERLEPVVEAGPLAG